jgi:hypothetical protein
MGNGIEPLGGLSTVQALLSPTTRVVASVNTGSAVPLAASAATVSTPAYRIDPELDLVIIELHQGPGTALATIPTERQLAAYRQPPARAASTPPATADTVAAATKAANPTDANATQDKTLIA